MYRTRASPFAANAPVSWTDSNLEYDDIALSNNVTTVAPVNSMDGPPRPTRGDMLYAGAKGLVSMVPFVGGPAGELLGHIVSPPIEKRRNEWFAALESRLRALEESGFDIEVLRENEAFIDALLHASRVALATGQHGKLVALRAAVINVACGMAIDETNRFMFIRIVEDFTELHLAMLALFNDPTDALAKAGVNLSVSWGSNLSLLVCRILPELAGHDALAEQIASELTSRGLVDGVDLKTTMTEHGLRQSRTTERGRSLLAFITDKAGDPT